MAQQIQWRRGTAAEATAANPILAEGEAGFETDTGLFKIGDGTTAWTALDYAGGGGDIAVPGGLDATGTPSASTFLRGDGTWATPAGGGGGDLLAANNLSDLANAGTARTNLGLGTAATTAAAAYATAAQGSTADAASSGLAAHLADTVDAHDASAVSFAAVGTIAGTDVQTAVAEVATDAASALSTHEADTTSVHGITNTASLYVAGGTDVAVADGGTGSSTAAGARTNLALVIGTDVAAQNPVPVVVSGTTDTLATADNGKMNRYTNASLVTVTLPTDAAEDLVDGFWCSLYAEGAGGLTLSTTGITLTGSSPTTTIVQNDVLIVIKTSTANTWITVGGSSGGGASMTAAEILAALLTVDGSGSGLDADLLDGSNSAAFATAAQGTTADGAVPKSLYDAQSIVIAVSDNTPAVQAVAASRIVGRKATGDVGVMTGAETGALIKLDELAAPTDVTTLNATTTAHGLLKKLSNSSTEYMNGQGDWATPAGGGGGSSDPLDANNIIATRMFAR